MADSADDWYRPTPYEERMARRWMDALNPAIGVGSRHHTVPAFYLKRFADGGNQLLVRDRVSGKESRRSVSDLAIRDFYTVLTVDGQFDGYLEQLLQVVEDQAKCIIDLLLSPFRRPGTLTAEEHYALCQFLAFQMVRGPRKRREIELMADYTVKIQAGDVLTDRDLAELTAVPHPNEHLRIMGPLAYKIHQYLLPRPVLIVWLDAPLLVTCDEPVLIDVENHVKHLPECTVSKAELAKRRRRSNASGGVYGQIVHAWPTRPSGVQIADGIVMPLTPKALLVLGRAGEQPPGQVLLSAKEASGLADDVNQALVAQAYEWVAAHPDHPTFSTWQLPPNGPLLGVCDGGSIMSERLKTPAPHAWQRLRKNWPGM
jgi:hypothetical protein